MSDISSITDTLSQLSVSSQPTGAPRFDPAVRLLHRFYEPLVLLRILDPTRGAQDYNSALDSELDDSHFQWRKFLDQLSWICDYRCGGKTVSAVAAEVTPDGPVFWLASNTKPAASAVPHLKWVLGQLETACGMSKEELDALENRITARCIEFSREKVRFYSRLLHGRLREASDLLAGKSNESDVRLLEDLQKLERFESQDFEICSTAFDFRHSESLQTLTQKHSTGAVRSIWSHLRHCIGRLGSWSKASKLLVRVAKALPQHVCGFHVDSLPSVPPIAAPAADSKTHLSGALRRMFQQQENNRLQKVQEILHNYNRVIDVSTQFVEQYTDKKFKPLVHAELLLLEHFHHRNLRFVESCRYIGCSKPSCYCCDLYIKSHPGQFAVRKTHGNLWVNWRAPIPPLENKAEAREHTNRILNDMIKSIRKDVVFQIESKAPPRPRIPDSTTGITTASIGLQPTTAQNLSSFELPIPLHHYSVPNILGDIVPTQQSSSSTAGSLNSSTSELNRIRGKLAKGGARTGVNASTGFDEDDSIQEQDPIERESEASEDEVIVFRGRRESPTSFDVKTE